MRIFTSIISLASLIFLAGCVSTPPRQGTTLNAEWYPSQNFDARRPNFVILHHTHSSTSESALRTLSDPQKKVSAHYLIGKTGRIYQLVDEKERAWHAGRSSWGGHYDINSVSIGIELVNNSEEPFPESQITSLIELLKDLKQRHHIPSKNIIGHGDVAPTRKVDPSHYFPWERLAQEGFGQWCWDVPNTLPVYFEPEQALRLVGYDTSNMNSTIKAFKRRFFPDLLNETSLSVKERLFLHCLASSDAE